jgi:hypothetical protein
MPTKKSKKEKPKDILVSSIVSQESLTKKELEPYTEVTWLMSLDISQPKLLTLLSKILTKDFSAHTTQKLILLNSSLVT